MTAKARISEADVTRLFRGARKAGYAHVRVGIDVAGNIVVDASDDSTAIPPARANPLDRLLEGK